MGATVRAGRLLEGCLQGNSPEHEEDRQRHHAYEFSVDEVRPCQRLVGLQVFQVGQSLGHPRVVDDRPPQAQPGEVTDQNNEADDRHVVGLGDDLAKIVVGHAETEIEQEQVHDRPRDEAVGHDPSVCDHGGKADGRCDEESRWPGHIIDPIADKRRQNDLAAEQVDDAHGLENQGDDTPDQRPEGPVDRLAQTHCGEVVVECECGSGRGITMTGRGFSNLREMRGVGSGGDGKECVRQCAQAVSKLERPGKDGTAQNGEDRQSIKTEKGDRHPVRKASGSRGQPGARGPLGNHFHVGDIGRRSRVHHGGQQVIPRQTDHHTGGKILTHEHLQAEVLGIASGEPKILEPS